MLVFVSSQRPKLETQPEMIFQLALNQPGNSSSNKSALQLISNSFAPFVKQCY